MKKWSTYEENSSKIEFNKKIEIVLENNTVLTGEIKVSGINESLACLDINKIKGSKITDYKILENVDVIDDLVDESDMEGDGDYTEDLTEILDTVADGEIKDFDFNLSEIPSGIRNVLFQIEHLLKPIQFNGDPIVANKIIDNAVAYLKSLK